ncbi:MAG: hypothetical protein MJ252_00900 [archaeon]|nr:hypothetical protein [archaeon]
MATQNKAEDKLNQMNDLQSSISYKLDALDSKVNKVNGIEKNQKEMQSDIDRIMGKIDDNIINQNYLNFYDYILNRDRYIKAEEKKRKEKEESLKESRTSIRSIKKEKEKHSRKTSQRIKGNNSIPSQEKEKEKEPQNVTKVFLSYKGNPKVNAQKIAENEELKEELKKRQGIFLTNELTNLKIKMKKMENQNKVLNTLINSQKEIKNTKLIDRFISSFIEKLSINWHEVVDIIIDELIEEEVLNLNEMELQKNYYKERGEAGKLFNEDYQRGFGENNLNLEDVFDDLTEAQNMLRKIKVREDQIKNIYGIK